MAELQRVVPELADRIGDLPQPLAGDPEGARSRLFEAVSSVLCTAAHTTPVLLVLDDLHWADKATLLLLKYLVRHPREARLMVLGTYRETELHDDHPLAATLAELGRERRLQRHAVAPLDATAVSQLVSLHTADAASAELRETVYAGTEGNPFFVVEVLRHLQESAAIGCGADRARPGPRRLEVPEGVKGVLRQRLARLGSDANRLLTGAAVIGRTFDLDVLQRVCDLTEDDLVDVLDAAVRARVVDEVPGAPGRHTFSHALIRDTLYEGLNGTRRALLHRRVGCALEQAHAGRLEWWLGELALHFEQAGDPVRAIEYRSRAGEHAVAQLAYELAAEHFRQVVAMLDTTPSEQRCDLVIAQGEAQRRAGDPAYRSTLLSAARLAQQLGDRDRLARAALANNRGYASSAEGVDRDRVAMLHAALAISDTADSPTRAALLALLALELTMDDDWRLRDELGNEAVAMGTARGASAHARAHAHAARGVSLAAADRARSAGRPARSRGAGRPARRPADRRPRRVPRRPRRHGDRRPGGGRPAARTSGCRRRATRPAVHALVCRRRPNQAPPDQRARRRGRAPCLRRCTDR